MMVLKAIDWKSTGRRALVALKLVLVPLLLVYLISKMRDQLPQLATRDFVGPIVVSLALLEISFAVVGLRFAQSLWAFARDATSLTAIRITFESFFYGLVLPSGIAIDMIRFLKLKSAVPALTPGNAIACLVCDRAVGAAAAFLLFAFSAWLVAPAIAEAANLPMEWVATGIFALIIVAIALSLMEKARHALSIVVATVIRSWHQVLLAIVLGLVFVLLTAAAINVFSTALGFSVRFEVILFGLAGGTVLTLVPFSLAGVGPGDIGNLAFLLMAGVDRKAALVIVSLAWLARAIGAIQGGIIELARGGQWILTKRE